MINNPSSILAADSGGQNFCVGMANMLKRGPVTVDSLRAAASFARSNPVMVTSWLENLYQDGSATRGLAKRSYWHPNGFAKLVLHVSRDPEFRIRLHVWPEVRVGSALGESNPHSHRWEFASTVIVGGGLHMVEYTEVQQGRKPYDRFRYGTDPANPAALRRDGTAWLARTSSPHVRRGQIYSCDTQVVHTVVPIESGLTATLVIQGPRRTSSTVVYRTPGSSDEQPNRELSESDFSWLVKSVVNEAIVNEARCRPLVAV